MVPCSYRGLSLGVEEKFTEFIHGVYIERVTGDETRHTVWAFLKWRFDLSDERLAIPARGV
jgi:hypothetical protein